MESATDWLTPASIEHRMGSGGGRIGGLLRGQSSASPAGNSTAGLLNLLYKDNVSGEMTTGVSDGNRLNRSLTFKRQSNTTPSRNRPVLFRSVAVTRSTDETAAPPSTNVPALAWLLCYYSQLHTATFARVEAARYLAMLEV